MKKTIFLLTTIFLLHAKLSAQEITQQMKEAVSQLDHAVSVNDYGQLADRFGVLAEAKKTDWLAYYYAAYCNAKTGWLYQDDGDKIEPFVDRAEEQIKKAQSLLDTAKQKNELSELYCVLSMTNRARVFMNPSSFGRKYGPTASLYTQLADKANPLNPRALWLAGWEKYSTPKMWGGDKNKAKELLENAIQILNAYTADMVYPHWGKKEVEELLKQLK